jgi:predicted dehydrogenase
MSYRIALIGCGRVGIWLEDDPLRVKPASHIGGIKKIIASSSSDPLYRNFSGPLELAALCDIDAGRLEEAGRRYEIPPEHLYRDYRRLILNEKPDIVIIATWTSTHRKIALFAAHNGVKGIVLEKPVAASISHAREIIDACAQHCVKLVVNHERRWDPLYKKTREIVKSNVLGELKLIYGNVLSRSAPRGPWETVLKEAGGGPLLHDGTHLTDLVCYFAGDIDSVTGTVKREDPEIGTETTASAMLRTASGVTVFLEAGGMRNYFNFELDLQFETGRIKVGNGIREYYVSEDSTRYTGFHDLVKQPFPSFVRDSDPFTGAIIDVIEAIETNEPPMSSGEDGLKAMEIIFGIYHSASLQGKPVKLPMNFRGHPLRKMFKNNLL